MFPVTGRTSKDAFYFESYRDLSVVLEALRERQKLSANRVRMELLLGETAVAGGGYAIIEPAIKAAFPGMPDAAVKFIGGSLSYFLVELLKLAKREGARKQ